MPKKGQLYIYYVTTWELKWKYFSDGMVHVDDGRFIKVY